MSGNHSGGWDQPVHGTDAQGNDVTASFGRGTKEGQTFLSDGHVDPDGFMDSQNHDHYGSGNGPNDNGTQRGQYTGYGT